MAALIASGGDPNAKARYGFTPLHFAGCYNSRAKVVTVLVAAGADINALAILDQTPLQCAAVRKNAKMVSALLAAGADADAGFKGGDTRPNADGRDETDNIWNAIAAAIVFPVPGWIVAVALVAVWLFAC